MNYQLEFSITLDDIRNKLSTESQEKYKYIKFTNATAYDKYVNISCILLEEPIKNEETMSRLSSVPDGYFNLD